MHRTRIKFCGITRPQDAAAAALAGADAIGLVFYSKAPRRVTLDRAREILRALPTMVTPVGLFVDSPASEVLDVTTALRLRAVQLHGHESPALVAQLSMLSITKVIHVAAATLATAVGPWREAYAAGALPQLAGVLLETENSAAPGGTGIENDWAALAEARAAGVLDGLPALIVAGGLTPDNVAAVVRRTRPWAVDVSSGIEAALCVKSAAKMVDFARAVRVADADGLPVGTPDAPA